MDYRKKKEGYQLILTSLLEDPGYIPGFLAKLAIAAGDAGAI